MEKSFHMYMSTMQDDADSFSEMASGLGKAGSLEPQVVCKKRRNKSLTGRAALYGGNSPALPSMLSLASLWAVPLDTEGL